MFCSTVGGRRADDHSHHQSENRIRRDDAPGVLDVAENVRMSEPGTLGFYISQDQKDPRVFTTYERFVDQSAMDKHNGSAATARFFTIAKPILDGDVVLVTATEISKK